ncbi:MAG: Flp pilus assembly complex ATPase component TadA [Nanoarchaeota archaeon]|nr:Flp pilus assembly complex ATPase component TadA [Nanoarchaeota archaeon]
MVNIIEQYQLKVNETNVNIKIIKDSDNSLIYTLDLPKFQKPTLAFIDEIKNTLISEISLTSREILDPKVSDNIKDRFKQKAKTLLEEYMPGLPESTKTYLINYLLNESLGLGKIEYFLQDRFLEEVIINSADEPIRVYHKRHGWLLSNVIIENEEQIINYSNIIARKVGKQITILNPLLDAHIITGDRANAVLYPISNKGSTITLRKFSKDPITMTDMITSNVISSEALALIWLSLEYEMNMIISGGTASGKTSFLNVCMPFIPPNHRIISIEDTRELYLPKYLYWCPLVTRLPNPEGEGGVGMLDLLINALRMRPDRVILGEIRKSEDARVLFEAMHTGHSVYSTVHADSANETVKRLVNPPIEVPENLLEAVHLNVVMFRDRRKNIRRTYQISEFILSEHEGKIKPNLIYRWKPAEDKVVKYSPSLRLFEQLSRHTGLSQTEIDKDIQDKDDILKFLIKKNIRNVHEVGKVMKEYYLNKDNVSKIVKKNLDIKKLLLKND